MAHLLAENLGRLKRVGHTCDIVTNYWVAALPSTRLCNSVPIDLKRFRVQLRAPVVRLVEESLVLLL